MEEIVSCSVVQANDMDDTESLSCTYEEDCAQVCNVEYDYQQVQAVEEMVGNEGLSCVVESPVEGVDVPRDDEEGHSPQDEMLLLAQGLYVDPTADCEGDDFQDIIPVGKECGAVGIRGHSILEPLDAFHM